LLRRLATERRTGVVLITHDMGVVADMADRLAVMYAGRIAETGPTAICCRAPRHPYTALLLASIPRLSDEPKSMLAVIEGRVPVPAEFGTGCRFASRCPRVSEMCRSVTPVLEAEGGAGACDCLPPPSIWR
jgi:oligopeptide/dipeptide ABC transporter ATP-binding protein